MAKLTLRNAKGLDAEIERRGLTEEVKIETIKRRLANRIRAEMVDQKLTKSAMCARMGTTRPQLDRVLDETDHNITLRTLMRAAKAVGRTISLDLV